VTFLAYNPPMKHTAAILCVVLAACGDDRSGPTGDTGEDPDAPHDTFEVPLDTLDDTASDPVDPPPDSPDSIDSPPDVPDETGGDPFGDPPEFGYPPDCGDDPSICCSYAPVECVGDWECRDSHCMYVCGDSAYHLACISASDCECFPAPIRCLGYWDCIATTCWYFCAE